MESKGKGARRGFALVLGVWLALLAWASSAAGQDPQLTVYGNARHADRIHLVVYGPPGERVDVFEDVDGRLLPLRSVLLDPVGAVWDIGRWRCDRRERRFVITLTHPNGAVETVAYETRTPSCRDRLALRVPARARPGARVAARISDRWHRGGIRPRLCLAPPGRALRCRTVRLASALATPRVRLRRRGSWRVELRFAGFRLRHRVQVGAGGLRRKAPPRNRVLLTGDSMMLNIASYVVDRLRGRVQTSSDTRAGTGVSKPGFDWIAHARRQMRRRHPQATVVFVGANDAFAMDTPTGARVECCYEPWIEEYARRVAAMMRVYRRNGTASSIWLTIPAPRSPALAGPIAAVNEGIRRAAGIASGVRVLRLDELFTPGFEYRAEMPVRGRTRRVRADDGLHLSLLGGRMAAARVTAALRALGVL